MQLLHECSLPCQPLCTRCAAEIHPSAPTPLTGAMHPLQGTRPARIFLNTWQAYHAVFLGPLSVRHSARKSVNLF